VLEAAGASADVTGGTLSGGAGGSGGYASYVAGAIGGTGGAGAVVEAGATLIDTGVVAGGAGGNGSRVYASPASGAGGTGAAGIVLAAGGTAVTSGTVTGGAGGNGGAGRYTTGNGSGGNGGVGVLETGAASLLNTGSVAGGAGGAAGTGGSGAAGHAGAAADGVLLQAGGAVVNGSSLVSSALIEGVVGVYAAAGAAATVTNFGTITGSSNVSVQLEASSDRVIDEAGGVFNGVVQGGGGILELASGSGTLTGLGTSFAGFGAYAIDTSGTWTVTGTSSLATGKTLTNSGKLTIGGSLTNQGVITGGAADGIILATGGAVTNTGLIAGVVGVYGGSAGPVTVTNFGTIQSTGTLAVRLGASSDRLVVEAGSTLIGNVQGGHGTLELAAGNGGISGLGQSITVFGTYIVDTGGSWTVGGTNTIAGGDKVTNNGTLALTGSLANQATITSASGNGITLQTGAVLNNGKGNQAALIKGVIGVYGAGGPATVINYGTIQGTGGTAVLFTSAADRLVVEQNAHFVGALQGGGGALELAGGAATITGLGAKGTLSGAEAATFSGFGYYAFDAGQLTLNGNETVTSAMTVSTGQALVTVNGSLTNLGAISAPRSNGITLASGGAITNGSASNTTAMIYQQNGLSASGPATVTNFGTISAGKANWAIRFGSSSDRLIDEAGSSLIGNVQGGRGTLELAAGNGAISGLGSSISQFGTYTVDAGGAWTINGQNNISGSVNEYGSLTLAGTLSLLGLAAITSTGGNGLNLAAGASLHSFANSSIRGVIGVYAGAGGAATVTNGGTITGTGGVSVQFKSTADRLILQSGATFVGAVEGGGGTLELAAAAGTITGLGETGTISGGEAGAFSGFGRYQIDAGTSWSLSGADTLGVNQTLSNAGTLAGSLSLSASSARLIIAGGASVAGAVQGGGGTLELATGSGTISGLGGAFSDFGSYLIDAGGAWTLYGANSIGAGQNVVVDGTLNLAGSLANAGTIVGGPGASGAYGLHNVGYPGDPGATAITVGSASASLTNTGMITGGLGGMGGQAAIYGGVGGAGGAAVAITYGGSMTNSGGTIVGGAGGQGGYSPEYAGGSGGEGGAGITLSAAGSVDNASGAITGGAGGAGNDFFFGAAGGQGGAGVDLGDGGSVALTGGTITGGAGGVGAYGYDYGGGGGNGGAGVALAAGGTVTDTGGAISGGAGGAGGYGYFGGGGGGAGGAGVLLSAGGTVSNTTGMIVGGAGGAGGGRNNGPAAPAGPAGDGVVLTAGGIVINGSATSKAALIEGLVGVYAGAGGAATVTSFGTIDGTGGTSVQFMSASDRLIVEAGSTWIGAAQGGGGTLELAGGKGTITGLGATGSVSKAEVLTFGGFGSYVLDAAGTWTLNGTNALAAGDSLDVGAALTISGTVTGPGTIVGLAGSKITLKKADLAGVTIQSATTIEVKGTVNILDGTMATLNNQASLVLNDAATVDIEGAIANSGTIYLEGKTATTGLIVKAAATLSGGGSVRLEPSAFNTITGTSVGATLTNVNNTIIGSGLLGAGKLVLVNQAAGLIEQTGTIALTIDTGTKTISNAGTIEAAGPGGMTIAGAVANTGLLEAIKSNLTVDGAVTGAGSAVINAGTLDFASSFSENVTFSGSTGQLELAKSQAFAFKGTVTGFSKSGGTSLDLRDIGFVSPGEATYISGSKTGGVLTVTDGTHTATITLAGNYANTFVASSDGKGGVIIVYSAAEAPHAPSAPAFVAAMAGIGAGGGSSTTLVASLSTPSSLSLARPVH
jgi:fibronectin-binding autotransporter adhesin